MPPLRVLFIGHTYVVGVNQKKLQALAQKPELRIGLLVPDRWRDREWQTTRFLERTDPSFTIYPAKVWMGGRGGAYLFPPGAIFQAIRDFHPDLIQVEQEVFSLSAFQLAISARVRKIPLVVFCWENMDKRLSLLRRWTRKFVLNTAVLILAGSRGAAELLRQWGYKGRIELIPELGVDTQMFHPVPRAENEVFTIGYVGRLVYQKGIDLLFAAAKELCEAGFQFRLVLCGTGPDENSLRELAKQMGIDDIITWRGAVSHENVPGEIARLNVLVLPSRTVPGVWMEQFGHVLIEAMAMGIPVAGSNSGAIPDVIGRDELIFSEGDCNGLRKVLEKLMADPDWRDQMIQYLQERVENQYTHQAIANQLIDMWNNVST